MHTYETIDLILNQLKVKSFRLSDHSGSSGGLVLPVGRKLTSGLVVTSKTVDTGLDKNQTELGVLVLAVTLKMLADGDSLLDELVQILRNLRGETVGLEDTENLVTSDTLDLGNAMGITKNDTNLGRGQTLLGKLEDLLANFLGGSLNPGRRSTAVRQGTARDTLSRSVHATHFC
jgi:hypothetical protein